MDWTWGSAWEWRRGVWLRWQPNLQQRKCKASKTEREVSTLGVTVSSLACDPISESRFANDITDGKQLIIRAISYCRGRHRDTKHRHLPPRRQEQNMTDAKGAVNRCRYPYCGARPPITLLVPPMWTRCLVCPSSSLCLRQQS